MPKHVMKLSVGSSALWAMDSRKIFQKVPPIEGVEEMRLRLVCVCVYIELRLEIYIITNIPHPVSQTRDPHNLGVAIRPTRSLASDLYIKLSIAASNQSS